MKYLSGSTEAELSRAALADKYSADTVFSSAVDCVLLGVAELFPPVLPNGEVEVLSADAEPFLIKDGLKDLKELLAKGDDNDESH